MPAGKPKDVKAMREHGADAGREIVEALAQVGNALRDSNALLERLVTGGRARADTAFDDFAIGREGSDPSAAAGADDEPVLRRLAKETGLTLPMDRLIALRNARYPQSHPRYWGIVDFDLHSATPRLFVFDVAAPSVAAYLCAHGRGSEGERDDGMAERFSNVSGSNASSLGIYRCAETYVSDDNGYSLRLDGLEATNSNARPRLIVMHGADYVSEEFAAQHKRIGRSEGCPALDHRHATTVIDQLKLGSLLIHWKTP